MIEEVHELLMFLSPVLSVWSSSRLILLQAKLPALCQVWNHSRGIKIGIFAFRDKNCLDSLQISRKILGRHAFYTQVSGTWSKVLYI